MILICWLHSAQGASLTEDELASLNRQVARAGGNLRKDDFVRLVRNSATFHKTFDKNKDNVVTKVGAGTAELIPNKDCWQANQCCCLQINGITFSFVVFQSEMATRCELAFRALDLNNKGPYRDQTTSNNLLYVGLLELTGYYYSGIQNFWTSWQGFISEPELEKLTRKLSERERGRLMSKLDKDGDGQVNLVSKCSGV